MSKKECPSCAMPVPEESKVCPICGFEFPAVGKKRNLLVILLLVIFLVVSLIAWWRTIL